MRSHRLDRLARLTQGVALLSLGFGDLACEKKPANEEPHINSPPQGEPHINATALPTAVPSAAPSTTAAPSASAPKPEPMPHTNAPNHKP